MWLTSSPKNPKSWKKKKKASFGIENSPFGGGGESVPIVEPVAESIKL